MTDSLQLARETVTHYVARDWEALGRCYAADAVLGAPDGWPESERQKGREAVIRQFQRLSEDWTQQDMTIRREAVRDEWAVIELEWRVRGAASGAAIDTVVSGAYRVRDGEVAEAHFFWEWEQALAVAGIDPPAG